jgi:hypothetical protein
LLLVSKAESASRGFALTSDEKFVREFRDLQNQIRTAFADPTNEVSDNPVQRDLLENTAPILTRRLAFSAEIVRLYEQHDSAAIAAMLARADGRMSIKALAANLEQFKVETEAACGSDSAVPIERPAALEQRSHRDRIDTDTGRFAGAGRTAVEPRVGRFAECHDGVQAFPRGGSGRAGRTPRRGAEKGHALTHSASVLENTFNTIAEGDFNNMLTVITGMMDVLTEDFDAAPL